MSKLSEMIATLCPNGVEYKKLGEICEVKTGGEPPVNAVKGKMPSATIIFDFFCSLSRALPFVSVVVRGKEDEG